MSSQQRAMDAIPVARGRLRLHVRGADGAVTTRCADNVVLAGGARMIASLFAGVPTATPINSVGVGFGAESAAAGATQLTPPSAVKIAAEALLSPIEAEDFTVATDADARHVRVSVGTTFKPTVELAGVTEAGLLAGDSLYNQVVFEPVTLHVGQDVTFFWEIDFPFGH